MAAAARLCIPLAASPNHPSRVAAARRRKDGAPTIYHRGLVCATTVARVVTVPAEEVPPSAQPRKALLSPSPGRATKQTKPSGVQTPERAFDPPPVPRQSRDGLADRHPRDVSRPFIRASFFSGLAPQQQQLSRRRAQFLSRPDLSRAGLQSRPGNEVGGTSLKVAHSTCDVAR